MTYTNEYGMVNGSSCSYVRLGRYNKCSNAEVQATPVVTGDYVYKGNIPSADAAAAAAAAAQKSAVNSTMVGANGQPVVTPNPSPAAPNTGVTEGFRVMRRENFETAVDPSYVPHYNVPNYMPINTNSLTSATPTCGGYADIMNAYGGLGSGNSCTTNFIQN